MKRLSALLSACALTALPALPSLAQPELVVLVRHAEPGSTPEGDPGLAPAGEQRVQALAQALGGLRVNAIFTSTWRRTRETAAPLAQAWGVPAQAVEGPPGGLAAHVQAVVAAVQAQTGVVLVVGHGNTVPAVLAALGGPTLPDLCDTSFHHVFLLQPGSVPRWAQLRVGEASAPPASGCL